MNLKYISFLFLSVLILFSCNEKETSDEKESKLILNGTVMNVGDREMVYLYSSVSQDKEPIDSVMLDSGRFNFAINWKGPEAVGI